MLFLAVCILQLLNKRLLLLFKRPGLVVNFFSIILSVHNSTPIRLNGAFYLTNLSLFPLKLRLILHFQEVLRSFLLLIDGADFVLLYCVHNLNLLLFYLLAVLLVQNEYLLLVHRYLVLVL